jgi:hypothetical protein
MLFEGVAQEVYDNQGWFQFNSFHTGRQALSLRVGCPGPVRPLPKAW